MINFMPIPKKGIEPVELDEVEPEAIEQVLKKIEQDFDDLPPADKRPSITVRDYHAPLATLKKAAAQMKKHAITDPVAAEQAFTELFKESIPVVKPKKAKKPKAKTETIDYGGVLGKTNALSESRPSKTKPVSELFKAKKK